MKKSLKKAKLHKLQRNSNMKATMNYDNEQSWRDSQREWSVLFISSNNTLHSIFYPSNCFLIKGDEDNVSAIKESFPTDRP